MQAPLVSASQVREDVAGAVVAVFRDKGERMLEFLRMAEGRDKFGKVFQFIFRMLAGILKSHGDTETAKRFEGFWRAMLDARRLHWFGKSVLELKQVHAALSTNNSPQEIRLCHAASRFCFGLRWAVENVMILCKVGLLRTFQWQDLNRIAKRFWSAALAFGLATEFLKLRAVWKDASSNERSIPQERAQKLKLDYLKTIVQHLGDSAVPLVIGWDANLGDAQVGFMHTIAGLIQSYNLFPKGA